MKVETFEVDEVRDQTMECSEEAEQLVESLGLEKQRRYYNRDDQDWVNPFPYRKMTAQEKLVLETLLPEKTELAKYGDAPIPLRVLQVAAYASEKIQTDFPDGALVVWHPENADYKDPYLILRTDGQYKAHELYILARWGEELDSFEVMKEKAKQVLRAKYEASLAKIKMELDVLIGSSSSYVNAAVEAGKYRDPSFYAH